MDNLTLSKDELEALLETINDLAIAPDCAQRLDEIVTNVGALLPFRRCIIVHERIKEPDAATELYVFSDIHAARNKRVFHGRESWSIGRYLRHFQTSPACNLQNAFFWQRLATAVAEPDGCVANLLKQLGPNRGIAASVGVSGEQSTLIQLQPAEQPFAVKHLWLVNSIALHLHGYFTRCTAVFDDAEVPHSLTVKEKEVLQWVMAGKTSWEVGRILSMSERTVKFHLHNIYTKLNVVNRAQAVTMASKLRLV